MKAKHLLIIGVVTIAGCWVWEGSNPITEPEPESVTEIITTPAPETANNTLPVIEPIVIEPIIIPPLAVIDPIPQPPPITPVVPPTTPPETGAAAIPALDQHPRYYRNQNMPTPVVIATLGKNSDSVLEIQIPKPPAELHGCNQAIMLGEHVPVIQDKNLQNTWWLIASTTSLAGFSPDKSVYFLWARKISETEVGAVATGVGTNLINIKDPVDAKIDTGSLVLPYQWISRLDNYNYFPTNPDESCVGGQ